MRYFLMFITNFMHVKVIRDEKGTPFLYRYHIFSFSNGPGICIHHFVKSDPDRGYHDHPWGRAMSFILCGRYEERILDLSDNIIYKTYYRNRFHFNFLRGKGTFHRVMIRDNEDAWTIFAFGRRRKTWGMIDLNGNYKPMSRQIEDNDDGWWKQAGLGYGIENHIKHEGNVIATVDNIILAESKILLIQRGKNPYKGLWAFPGGRIEQRDPDIITSAYRELNEETNLDKDINNVELKYVKTIGNNTRDPRGFCITNVFMANLPFIPDNVRAGDDAVNFNWFPIDDLPEMAFDHKEILSDILTTQQ